jgi:Zn-dependent protease
VSSQFSSGEILSIIAAWIVLSVAITYRSLVSLLIGTSSVDVVIAGFVATATGFVLHEMGHKYVAIRRRYLAHFRLWIWGLVLTISIVTLSGGGLVFGAPGAVNMIISAAAGPGINLAFAVGFLLVWLSVPAGFLSTIAVYGLLLNVGLGSFNMLPVSLLDGAKIFRKSIPIGLGIALPLWAMFIIFNFFR